ncbi:hypothetical protein BO79DRAFT_184424 [Aspergillus costaricaensis CBS 115574]|uniref:ER-bound oxygenase mpaB/mpaB'/Rubber oxygenase catalytic domain-containing protein n=2 Tax=Aspergillus subgen. Circumdati TaxID=2720871 RepID=A0A1L9NFR6_ASPTC|nr:hypothetical protein BO79DRAFT_184424 [Aspergillus costaricaensis CBS 115574]OJI88107.1 hypothetical protein ASPTUDRAFT_35896 [Aspergillus tubingensis CBS 134.48]RAK94124.1 hypothetical protein BO79DRAFT_184424 [Aspergillus costaricaensis CBS 115574]
MDEKAAAAASDRISPVSSQTTTVTTNHLEALDKLEILPQILQEGILFAGSGAALLLQAAYPNIKSAFEEANKTKTETITPANTSNDSNLANDLSNTLQTALSYIACLVFGTKEEKKLLLDLLQKDNAPLPTKLPCDPYIQLWLTATLYATATDFYQRIYGRVDYRTAEKAYIEFTTILSCLNIAKDVWPPTRQAFWTYWDDQIERLNVSGDAHLFAKDLLNRTDFPRWVSTVKPLLRVITIEMLPPRIREAYGLKSSAKTRGLYRGTMGFSVAVYPALPASMRGYPLRYYLGELKAKLNA